MKRILFVWDAAGFGGHDISALVALEELAGLPDFKVGALHTGRNPRLRDELHRLAARTGRLEVVEVPAGPAFSESFDGLFRGPRTRALQTALVDWKPDWTVHVQGFITLGLCALGACRAAGIPAVSYLPMAQRVWMLRPALVSLAQDFVNRRWYAVPDAFITTSARMKEMLVQAHGVSPARVAVVEYGPVVPVAASVDRAAARAALGLPEPARILGVLGRVEFRQKQQDFLIRAVARHRTDLAGMVFAIVGDGLDLAAARGLAEKCGVADQVRFLPWQTDMAGLYAALDAVLIPSRFEGVPLVMLEAMARRIPVLGSAVDGLADFLPPECLFPSGDDRAMVARIRALPGSPGPEVLEQLARLVVERLNARNFAEGFAREIQRLAAGGRP